MKPIFDQDGIGRPLLAAATIFAVCAVGLIAWSASAPVSSAVLAQGEIAVQGSSKTVQHLEGGIVAELLVADGEQVRAGQPLLRLDVTRSESERAMLAAEREALFAQSARLRAELAELSAPDFSGVDPRWIAGEAALFEARVRERAAERDMLEGALRRMESRRAAIAAERESIVTQVTLMAEDAEAKRQLADRGIIAPAALREIERMVAAMRGTEASLAAQLSEAEASEAEARLGQVGTDTRRVSAISQDLSRVTARLAEIQPALISADEIIARAEVIAPVGGEITGLAIATIGGVIAPGAVLMRIVPEGAVLVVEARVRPADRERLVGGMAGQIRLPSVERHGETSVEGRVTGISADRTTAATAAEQGDYYLLTLRLEETALGRTLVPGMPVTVVIPTSARSVVDYILSPIRDAIANSMREV